MTACQDRPLGPTAPTARTDQLLVGVLGLDTGHGTGRGTGLGTELCAASVTGLDTASVTEQVSGDKGVSLYISIKQIPKDLFN